MELISHSLTLKNGGKVGEHNSTTKSPSRKAIVSVSNYKNGLRLRWSFKGSRPELYIPQTITNHSRIANAVKSIIESDLVTNCYDESLERYNNLIEKASLQESAIDTQLIYVASYIQANKEGKGSSGFSILKEFDNYLAAKGVSLRQIPNYYYYTLQMIKRWGNSDTNDIPMLLQNEKLSNRTFNDRRNCLYKFFEWCVKKRKIESNPLEDVINKRKNKSIPQRVPFTDLEAQRIIDALKTDKYSKNNGYPHSQYWRFVVLLFHIGCRPGEALGLLVKEVNFEDRELRIARSFSRTRKGSNIKARILKGTKMENVRVIPMDDYLYELLYPLCINREPNDFVLVNKNWNPIDDRMFERRVFKPLLKHLKIENRDLYACRHTFATRAVRQGMKPHEVAYIMGDSVETVLNNYFHNNRRPESLPKPVTAKVSDLKVA